MSLGALHKWVSYLYALLGLCALGLGDHLGSSALGLLLSGLALTWFVEGPILHRPSYVKLWNGAALSFLGVQVLRGVFTDEPILALGVQFAGFLQIDRLASRRSVDEHRHIAALGFLHLIAATVLSTEVEYGFLFFGFVIVTPWMLALTHLRGAIEASVAPAGVVDDAAFLRVKGMLEARGVIGPAFLVGTASLSLPLFAITAALFLLFPRVGMGFLSFGAEEGQRVAGFGEDVQLGGFGVIRDDPSIVLRITPPRLPDEPAQSARFRLRGTSFDHYEAGRWSRTPDAGRRVAHELDYYPIARGRRPGRDREYRIVLNALDQPVLFLPEGTVGLSIAPRMVQGVPRARRLVQRPGLDVRYADGDGLDVLYSAWVDEGATGLAEPLLPDERALYLALPPGQERIAALARELTAGVEGPSAIADRVASFLRDSGELTYSLELPAVGDRDPLSVFLFEAKRGHCEYYSSAMAVMLRTLGIPSRNVTGFVGGEWNAYGGYYALRNGDAHSWVEAYVGDRWRTYDPTPPIRDAMGPGDSPFADVRAFFDALRVEWARRVVGYDLQSQVRMLRSVWGWFRAMRHAGEGHGERGLGDAAERSSAGLSTSALFGAAFAAALVLALSGLVALALRRARSKVAEPEAARLFRALERAMARHARPRAPSETPEAWARAIAPDGSPHAAIVREVMSVYAEARYRGRAVAPERMRALFRAVRRIRGAS